MKKALFIVALIIGSTSLFAQTVTQGPVDTSMRFAWELPTNISLSDASTFEVRLRDSLQTGVVTALTGIQCVAGTNVSCTAQLISANVDALNRVGVHQLSLTLYRADVGESPQSLPFTLQSPAGAPINPRITR